MAKASTKALSKPKDRVALKHWRKVLPGVPDDEIVLPRNMANGYSFPIPSKVTNSPEIWACIDSFVYQLLVAGPPGKVNAHIESVRKVIRRAFRWWDSLGEPTPLMLNQKFYTRHGKWKNPADVPELWICWSLCLSWLNLPANERSAGAAKLHVRGVLTRAITSAKSR